MRLGGTSVLDRAVKSLPTLGDVAPDESHTAGSVTTLNGRRKLTSRGRSRRLAIIATATRLFAEQGYHPTSVQDIVADLGVGKGVFYWYFPSKDELLSEILRVSLFDLRTAQERAIGTTENPLERLEQGIRASVRWYADNQDLVRVTLFCYTEERFAQALLKGRRVSAADTARHVSDAIDQQLLAPCDPTLTAIGIIGVVDELGRSMAFGGRRLDDGLEQFAVDMCLHGVVGQQR